MKAILVIDMPDNPNPDDGCSNCKGCPFVSNRDQSGWRTCDAPGYKFNFGVKSKCPLRPLPHKLQADWYTDGYKEGFNACLDEITGENNESNISN